MTGGGETLPHGLSRTPGEGGGEGAASGMVWEHGAAVQAEAPGSGEAGGVWHKEAFGRSGLDAFR